MCDPVTATVLAIATTGVSIYAQNEAADAQRDAINAQAESERREALESAEEELGQRVRAACEQRARMRVAAGEAGALGQSFAASINQSLQDQDNDAALVAKNVAFSQRAADDRRNTELSQVRHVSSVEAGLAIATAGVGGVRTGKRLRDVREGKSTSSH